VDFDIKPAYDLAMIENEFNVSSTFFIMTTSFTYNPMHSCNRKMLKEMSDLGFEIGLHFDPWVYGDMNDEELFNKLNMEAEILSSITGKKVKSLSLHNPSMHGEYPLFKEYKNAYDPRIFSPEKYISDSIMVFRHDIYEFLKKSKDSTIQVLLHPLHYSENEKIYPEIFCDFIHRFINDIDTQFRPNSTYSNCMDSDLLTYLVETRKNGVEP
jgi:peptidoglycan/xylan/chitin deacetylase (PgdA/CDA1 family)